MASGLQTVRRESGRGRGMAHGVRRRRGAAEVRAGAVGAARGAPARCPEVPPMPAESSVARVFGPAEEPARAR